MQPRNSSDEETEAGANLDICLPTDLVQWEQLRGLLEELRSSVGACAEPRRTVLLLSSLQNARQLVLNAHCSLPEPPFYVKSGWALGLGRFLTDCLDAEERERFFECTLPSIVQLVINLDFYRPPGPLHYCIRQREGQVSLARGFIASLIGAAFLCLFPEPSPVLHENLNDLNFCQLFRECSAEQPFLAHKLRCFLNYFDNVMLMSAANLSEPVIFRRCVLPSTLALSPEELLGCELPLCQLLFDPAGPLENASRQLMHIDFASAFIGGGILRTGAAQEEIKFAQCPELLAGSLFMECLDDNEAVLIANYRAFSRCSGSGPAFHFLGSLSRSHVRSETPLLCAIDALPFCSWYQEDQYFLCNLMREVNKAYTGFSQSEVSLGAVPRSKPPDVSGSSEESEVEDFAGQLVHQAIDKALQDLSLRRASGGSLPADFLPSVRAIVSTSSSSTRSSFTSRSSRRGSSRRSSELSSCAGNDEAAGGPGELLRDAILEEEMTEEEEEEEEVEEGEEEPEEVKADSSCVMAPPILLQAPICDSSKLSLSQEYLTSQGSPGQASPAGFGPSARFGARRNSSPLRLGQRLEHRRNSIPSHIRLLPLCDSAKMAANSGLSGFSRAHNSSDSERLSVRSFRSWGSSCANFGLGVDVDEAGSDLDVWAGALAQHLLRDALADVGERFCTAQVFAEDFTQQLIGEAVTEAAEMGLESCSELEKFAETEAAVIMTEAITEAAQARSRVDAYARHLSRHIVGRAVRRAARSQRQARPSFSISSAASSLSIEDLRDFESRLSLDAERPTPSVDFPPGPASLEDFEHRLPSRHFRPEPRRSLPREDLLFFDALDVPYGLLEGFAERFSRETFLSVRLDLHKKVTGSATKGIATGNWGCGTLGGNPQLKCIIQWIAASVARSPLLLYHCYGDPRMLPLLELAEDIRARRLTVGDVFAIIHDFCAEGGRQDLAAFVRAHLPPL